MRGDIEVLRFVEIALLCCRLIAYLPRKAISRINDKVKQSRGLCSLRCKIKIAAKRRRCQIAKLNGLENIAIDIMILDLFAPRAQTESVSGSHETHGFTESVYREILIRGVKVNELNDSFLS